MTELEKKILQKIMELVQEEIFEEETSYIIKQIHKTEKIDKSILKGVIGSLVKKQYLKVGDVNGAPTIIVVKDCENNILQCL